MALLGGMPRVLAQATTSANAGTTSTRFTVETVPALARSLAGQPYRAPDQTLPAWPAGSLSLTPQGPVRVDGAVKHTFPVSTGREGYTTPAGAYGVTRMYRAWALASMVVPSVSVMVDCTPPTSGASTSGRP